MFKIAIDAEKTRAKKKKLMRVSKVEGGRKCWPFFPLPFLFSLLLFEDQSGCWESTVCRRIGMPRVVEGRSRNPIKRAAPLQLAHTPIQCVL